MTYLSESVQGQPIAVTGIAVVPAGDAPNDGRTILTVAHGTTGIADRCAPSHNPRTVLPDAVRYINAGYVVAISDYEGLGTPGRHPYLVGESEGRSVLDAAKAVRQLPAAPHRPQLAIWGYSQRGHAALWAAQLADEWAPELDLVGTAAGGIPADLAATGETLRTGPGKGYLLLTIIRIPRRPPRRRPVLGAHRSRRTRTPRRRPDVQQRLLAHFANTDPDQLFKPLGPDDTWTALLTANNPGQARSSAPILMIHGTDDFLPVDAVQRLYEQMCTNGQHVELRTIDRGNHDTT